MGNVRRRNAPPEVRREDEGSKGEEAAVLSRAIMDAFYVDSVILLLLYQKRWTIQHANPFRNMYCVIHSLA